MILDDSYYSSVRYPSKMRVRLVKHSIPTLTPRVEEGFAMADFTGFENYNYITSFSTNESVKRPLGNFGYWAETYTSNTIGTFDNTPIIQVDFGYDLTAKKVCIFVNADKGEKITQFEYYDANQEIVGTIEPSGDLIEIEAPEGQEFFQSLTIKIISTKPNSKVNVGAIIIGDVIEVESNDIVEASINSSGDITGAKITSQEFNISLYDSSNRYNDKFNAVVINHIYNEYISPNVVFFTSEILQDLSSEIPITKIKAVDVIAKLTDLHTSQNIKTNFNDLEEIGSLVESAKLVVGFGISLQLSIHDSINSTVINITPFFQKQYNELLHSLSFMGAHLYKTNNDVIEIFNFNQFDGTADKSINIKECYEKPTKKEYPLIKNSVFSFTNSSLAEKETIFESVEVGFSYSAGSFVGRIKLPDNYYIPENKEGYIFYVAEYEDGSTQLKDIVSDIDGLSYNIQNGFLYIYESEKGQTELPSYKFSINANKITISVVSLPQTINTSGEDLEFKSNILSLPINVISEKGIEWESVYTRIILPYNYNKEYYYKLRGRFEIVLYDTILAEIEKNKFCKCVVTEHKLAYNGSYKSEMKVVAIGEPMSYLYPSNKRYPSNNLYPTNEMKGV